MADTGAGAPLAFGNPVVDKMLRDMQKIESIAGVSGNVSQEVTDPSSSGRRSRGPRDFSDSLKIESEIRKSDKSKRKPRRNASMENLSKARLGESSVPTSPLAMMNLSDSGRARAGSMPFMDLMSGLDILGAAAAEAAGEEEVPVPSTQNEKKKKKKPVRRNASLPTSLSSLTAQSNSVLTANEQLGQQAPGASVQAPQSMTMEDEAGPIDAQGMKMNETMLASQATAKPKKKLRRNSSLPTSLSGITVRSDIHTGLTPILEGQRMGDSGLSAPEPSGGIAVDEVAQLRSENEILRQQLSHQAYLSSGTLSAAMHSASQSAAAMAAQLSGQPEARAGPHRTYSADAINSMTPEFAASAHALGRSGAVSASGHFAAAAMAQQSMQSPFDVRATVLSNMTKHRSMPYAVQGAEQEPSVPTAASKSAAAPLASAAVALECKHPGCNAKLVIGGDREKQVIGAHNHTLCQRGCWTCKNFVYFYMTYYGREER